MALIVPFILFGFVSTAHAAWYDSNWQYRKKLTLDAGLVQADETNFPVLISFTDSDLAADAQDDGDDILFTKSDGTSKLDHEIESFNGTSGQLVAWVGVQSLSSSTDTEIYMYYGYGDATNQENAGGVWDEGGLNYYKGVWHLSEEQSGTGNVALMMAIGLALLPLSAAHALTYSNTSSITIPTDGAASPYPFVRTTFYEIINLGRGKKDISRPPAARLSTAVRLPSGTQRRG